MATPEPVALAAHQADIDLVAAEALLPRPAATARVRTLSAVPAPIETPRAASPSDEDWHVLLWRCWDSRRRAQALHQVAAAARQAVGRDVGTRGAWS